MSSPKTAAGKSARRPQVRSAVKRVQPAVKRSKSQRAARPADEPANGGTGSAQATRLAAEIERALAGGRRDVLSKEALQALMAAVCKTYAAHVAAGEELLPLPQRGGATATDVMITARGLRQALYL